MWFLNFFPDDLLHLIVLSVLGTGGVLYLFGLFINFFPTAYPYREPIRILSTVLIVLGVYGYGSYANEMSWRNRVSQVENQVLAAQIASDEANAKLEVEHDKKMALLKERGQLYKAKIKTEIIRIDGDCRLDPVVPKIHNDAAKNPFTGAK